jgi:hypothetical protein
MTRIDQALKKQKRASTSSSRRPVEDEEDDIIVLSDNTEDDDDDEEDEEPKKKHKCSLCGHPVDDFNDLQVSSLIPPPSLCSTSADALGGGLSRVEEAQRREGG